MRQLQSIKYILVFVRYCLNVSDDFYPIRQAGRPDPNLCGFRVGIDDGKQLDHSAEAMRDPVSDNATGTEAEEIDRLIRFGENSCCCGLGGLPDRRVEHRIDCLEPDIGQKGGKVHEFGGVAREGWDAIKGLQSVVLQTASGERP